MKPEMKKCDECESDYFVAKSPMASLCPECAHILYNYPNCSHIFENNRCIICYWDGKTSEYIDGLKKKENKDLLL